MKTPLLAVSVTLINITAPNSAFSNENVKKAKEQILNIGNSDDPKTLDPQKCNETTCTSIVKQLFEGLVSTDVQGNIIPASAEKWTISKDGTVYTFYLRKNLQWSDHSPVTAKDFVYSFQRLVDPATASEQSALLETVENGSDIILGKKSPSTLGVKAVNDHTFEIKLSKPSATFFENLTVTNTFPVQEKALLKHKDDFTHVNNLVSNGPFVLSYRKVGDKVTVVRNNFYWNKNNYFIEKINFFSVNDQNSELSMFEAGQLDITATVPQNKFQQIKSKYSSELNNNPYLASYVYLFNTKKPPFNNAKLRRALSIAVDRDIITKAVLGMGQKPLYDIVPYGIKNYTQNVVYWQNWPRQKQLEEAKKLYQEAGYSAENPLKLQILYNTSESHKKIATSIASMWKTTLGVQVVTINEEWKTMLDKKTNGDFEVLRLGNVANVNDASDFLNSYRSNDPSNDPKYSNSEYDKLINSALYEADKNKRKSLLENASKIIQEDVPLFPIYSYVSSYLKRSYVIGFKKNSMEKYSLQGVYLAEKTLN